jgi:hypothetical protein
MRQITVCIEGKEYTFPANMGILRRAEDYSGISTAKALTPDCKEFGSAGFILGVLAAGLEYCGETLDCKVLDATGQRPGFMEKLGNLISWEDMDAIYVEIWRALKPDLVAQAEAGVDEEAGESEDPPAGLTGSGSPTGSLE